MALINCPECNEVISDKAKICIKCGYPIEEMKKLKVIENKEGYYTICPNCKEQNKLGIFQCEKCNYRYKLGEYKVIDDSPINCPKCGGVNCSKHLDKKTIIPEKRVNKTSLNLNPFNPFTIYNTKEKIIHKEISKEILRYKCNECGYVFDK